jgi:hypothetical protein
MAAGTWSLEAWWYPKIKGRPLVSEILNVI